MNRNHPPDRFTPALLNEKIFEDKDFSTDLTLCLYSKDILSGFGMAVLREGGIGYIKLLAVEKGLRRRGLGRAIYNLLERRLKAGVCRLIRIYNSSPNYLLPGISPELTPAVFFLKHLGFVKYAETCNMKVDLTDEFFPVESEIKKLESKGISIRKAQPSDLTELTLFLEEDFPAWISEAEEMFSGVESTVFIVKKEKRIIGFAGYDANNKGMGWFGPMGVEERYRGSGIGSVLLKICLNDMRKKYNRAIIPWVSSPEFYIRAVDARIERTFWQFEKRVQPI